MLSDKTSVRDLVYLLRHHGVTRVVISPGSRNAPLSLSFDRHPDFETFVVIDERSAGFVAMGMAQQSGAPVAVCSTSGSAAYNYAPAVSEAWFQRIPLVVLTADRPEEWVGQGDGQTIFQSGIYGPHVRASVDVSEDITNPNRRLRQWRDIHEALLAMRDGADGPVHFNVHLREPLYQLSAETTAPLRTPLPPPALTRLHEADLQVLNTAGAAASRVLVLAGCLPPDALLQQHIERLSEQPNVLVLTEHMSNLTHPRFVGCIDRLLMTFSPLDLEVFRPDILITIGTNIVSKKIKALFRTVPPAAHWHVDPHEPQMDTFSALTRSFRMQPADFFAELGWQSSEQYAQPWVERESANQQGHAHYAEQAPFSDFTVLDQVHRAIPAGSVFQMGNSTVVRYFLLDNPRTDIRYFSNRGTSGIDGGTSTAVGANLVYTGETWMVSGDVAFFYDSNAFWNNLDKTGLKAIVINNAGGGIFRIIDGPSDSGSLERYFESHHQRDAQALCTNLGIDYRQADDAASLAASMDWLKAHPGGAVLEVFTPRTANADVLKRYFATLKQAAQLRSHD